MKTRESLRRPVRRISVIVEDPKSRLLLPVSPMYLTNRPVLPESEQGQQLFEYLDPADEVVPIGSEDVNEYLQKISGQPSKSWLGG